MRNLIYSLVLIILMLGVISCTPAARYSGQQPPPKTEATETVDDGQEEFVGQILQESEQLDNSVIDINKMDRIVAKYLSVPYQLGGTGSLGFDCSGLVYVVYRDYNDSRLPITVSNLYKLKKKINLDNLNYGDLIFFKIDSSNASHVGIYLGDATFVHASKSRGVVIDSLTDDYYAKHYVGARRVIE